MKNRILRHELFRNPRFVEMPIGARLFYLALLCHVDDAGLCVDDVTAIALECAPACGVDQVDDNLESLVEAGFVHRWSGGLAIHGFVADQPMSRRRYFAVMDVPPEITAITASRAEVARAPRRYDDAPKIEPYDFIVQLEKTGPVPNEMVEPERWPAPQAGPPAASAHVSNDVWRERIHRFRSGRPWFPHHGPKPGTDGCLAPRDVLIEFDYDMPGY